MMSRSFLSLYLAILYTSKIHQDNKDELHCIKEDAYKNEIKIQKIIPSSEGYHFKIINSNNDESIAVCEWIKKVFAKKNKPK